MARGLAIQRSSDITQAGTATKVSCSQSNKLRPPWQSIAPSMPISCLLSESNLCLGINLPTFRTPYMRFQQLMEFAEFGLITGLTGDFPLMVYAVNLRKSLLSNPNYYGSTVIDATVSNGKNSNTLKYNRRLINEIGN